MNRTVMAAEAKDLQMIFILISRIDSRKLDKRYQNTFWRYYGQLTLSSRLIKAKKLILHPALPKYNDAFSTKNYFLAIVVRDYNNNNDFLNIHYIFYL